MLPKIYRLPTTIKLDNPKHVATPFFRISIQENTLGHNRFGFVVSKKIDSRAVVRNRLKRVLREAVKDVTQAGKGTDILFIVTKTFLEEKSENIFTIVHDLLQQHL